MTIRLWCLLVAITAAACGGYNPPDEIYFGSLVYTQQAPGTTFTAYKTYYLDTTVDVWKNGGPSIPSATLPPSTEQVIDTRMAAYGYTKVTIPPGPGGVPNSDVGMRLAYIETTTVIYANYCSIYWAYYPCWPTWGYAGSYSSGTVLMLMIDTRTTPPTTTTLWAVGLYGVLTGTTLNDTTKLNNAMNRAFDQSPYLVNH